VSDERRYPNEPAEGVAGGAGAGSGGTPRHPFSALERARRAWSRRPASGAAATGTGSLPAGARAATIDPAGSADGDRSAAAATADAGGQGARIDSERSAVREPGSGPRRTDAIRALAGPRREISIVELRDVAASPAAGTASEAGNAGGGEAPRRRLRWVGWISRRVFHDHRVL